MNACAYRRGIAITWKLYLLVCLFCFAGVIEFIAYEMKAYPMRKNGRNM